MLPFNTSKREGQFSASVNNQRVPYARPKIEKIINTGERYITDIKHNTSSDYRSITREQSLPNVSLPAGAIYLLSPPKIKQFRFKKSNNPVISLFSLR